ncbi:MAG TPA: RNA methyltransferase [Burkholderiaceae bacterium]|nr:RNA methyltransferase [Burkholderiaceae bacterium]
MRAAIKLGAQFSASTVQLLLATVFDRIRFLLVAPSHPGNIGAAARAVKTMGFRRLVVVNPRYADYRDQGEAIALATGAADVLAASESCATLAQALAGVTTAYAMTGYDRQFGPPMIDVRSAALHAAQALHERDDGDVAFVFGTERDGLLNEDVERCQFCCAIPASAEFSSLNLAQAVQVVAYECQVAVRGTPVIRPQQARFAETEAPVSVDALEGLYVHLEQAIVSIGYLDPSEPKHLMARLRRLINRARPTQTELDVLRGISAAIIESRSERAGRKK